MEKGQKDDLATEALTKLENDKAELDSQIKALTKQLKITEEQKTIEIIKPEGPLRMELGWDDTDVDDGEPLKILKIHDTAPKVVSDKLQDKDQILSINGHTVKTLDQAQSAIASTPAGNMLIFEILRQKQTPYVQCPFCGQLKAKRGLPAHQRFCNKNPTSGQAKEESKKKVAASSSNTQSRKLKKLDELIDETPDHLRPKLKAIAKLGDVIETVFLTKKETMGITLEADQSHSLGLLRIKDIADIAPEEVKQKLKIGSWVAALDENNKSPFTIPAGETMRLSILHPHGAVLDGFVLSEKAEEEQEQQEATLYGGSVKLLFAEDRQAFISKNPHCKSKQPQHYLSIAVNDFRATGLILKEDYDQDPKELVQILGFTQFATEEMKLKLRAYDSIMAVNAIQPTKTSPFRALVARKKYPPAYFHIIRKGKSSRTFGWDVREPKLPKGKRPGPEKSPMPNPKKSPKRKPTKSAKEPKPKTPREPKIKKPAMQKVLIKKQVTEKVTKTFEIKKTGSLGMNLGWKSVDQKSKSVPMQVLGICDEKAPQGVKENFQEGDELVLINGHKIADIQTVVQACSEVELGESLKFVILRMETREKEVFQYKQIPCPFCGQLKAENGMKTHQKFCKKKPGSPSTLPLSPSTKPVPATSNKRPLAPSTTSVPATSNKRPLASSPSKQQESHVVPNGRPYSTFTDNELFVLEPSAFPDEAALKAEKEFRLQHRPHAQKEALEMTASPAQKTAVYSSAMSKFKKLQEAQQVAEPKTKDPPSGTLKTMAKKSGVPAKMSLGPLTPPPANATVIAIDSESEGNGAVSEDEHTQSEAEVPQNELMETAPVTPAENKSSTLQGFSNQQENDAGQEGENDAEELIDI